MSNFSCRFETFFPVPFFMQTALKTNLATELLNSTDFERRHDRRFGNMPYHVKSISESYEDMLQILLMLKILSTPDSQVKVICAAVSSSELSLFLGHLLFSLALDPVQDDLQHYLTPMTDEAAALSFWQSCRLSFLGSSILSDWVHGVGQSTVLQILLHTFVKLSLILSVPD